MKQNIYDHPDFFAGYQTLRRTERGLNAALEWPAFRSMLPPLSGKRVLDLGSGFGPFCHYAAERGADRVVGVDISTRMLEWARRENSGERITYFQSPIEDADFDPTSFDLVASSLALHYVEQFDGVCANVNRWHVRDVRRASDVHGYDVPRAVVPRREWHAPPLDRGRLPDRGDSPSSMVR